MMMQSRSAVYALAFSLALAAATSSSAQVRYASGQNVVPVFEGWQRNPDGTFTMWFGYLNRNWEEALNIPIGPNNKIEPGGPDRGQLEYFYPRRDRFVFAVKVPGDWSKDKDVVWTLTASGKTETAYGSLWPVWEIDEAVIFANRGGGSLHATDDPNTPPVITNAPPDQTVTLGSPVTLTISVIDDGQPMRLGFGGRPNKPFGLKVTWIQFRGPGKVSFSPERIVKFDGQAGKATTSATFDEPGNYVLRAFAEDGALFTTSDVTIMVNAPASR